jgi:hypothetical protein
MFWQGIEFRMAVLRKHGMIPKMFMGQVLVESR